MLFTSMLVSYWAYRFVQFGFDELGFRKIRAETALDNIASRAVLIGSGFKLDFIGFAANYSITRR